MVDYKMLRRQYWPTIATASFTLIVASIWPIYLLGRLLTYPVLKLLIPVTSMDVLGKLLTLRSSSGGVLYYSNEPTLLGIVLVLLLYLTAVAIINYVVVRKRQHSRAVNRQ